MLWEGTKKKGRRQCRRPPSKPRKTVPPCRGLHLMGRGCARTLRRKKGRRFFPAQFQEKAPALAEAEGGVILGPSQATRPYRRRRCDEKGGGCKADCQGNTLIMPFVYLMGVGCSSWRDRHSPAPQAGRSPGCIIQRERSGLLRGKQGAGRTSTATRRSPGEGVTRGLLRICWSGVQSRCQFSRVCDLTPRE